MLIVLIDSPMSRPDLVELAKQGFGDMVKGVVDIQKKVMILGADLHADEEAILLEQGSRQQDLWGINLYPDQDDMIEFDSMINLRPSQGNHTRGVNDPTIRSMIHSIVQQLVKES